MARRHKGAPAERAMIAAALCVTLVTTSGGMVLAASTSSSAAASVSVSTAAASSSAAGSAAGAAASSSGSAGAAGSSAASGASSATAPATAASTASSPAPAVLPPSPVGLNPALRLAAFTLPINGFGGSGLGSATDLDQTVMPIAALEQRTFFADVQQWEAQGAKPAPANANIAIDVTHPIGSALTSSAPTGSPGISIAPKGTVADNATPALVWPTTVDHVDYDFTVPTTGLYEMSVDYYNYPTCAVDTSKIDFTTNQDVASETGPLCGRSSSAERAVAIDPPGTVPTVPTTAVKPPNDQSVVAAAVAAGVDVNNIPGWIDTAKTVTPIAPSPAWTLANAKNPSSTPCAVSLNGPGNVPVGYDGYEYEEAQQIPFTGLWSEPQGQVDPKTGYVSFPKDNRGDNLYPIAQEAETWQTSDVRDSQGVYRDPLLFCLTAGSHVLRLSLVREPMAIAGVTFHGTTPLPTYAQALAKWQAEGLKPVTCGMCLKVQAENIYRMSDFTIRPGSDGYPSVEPPSNGYLVLNDLDGTFFQQQNEWVEYKIDVPQDGLYQLAFKDLQAQLEGLPASFDITVDGTEPFDGAQWVSVPFRNQWNVVGMAQPNGQPAVIGLTKGEHILRIRLNEGLIGQTLAVIQQATQRLGELQREIIMITGPNPQPTVSYNLQKSVPGLIPEMLSVVQTLDQQAAILTYDAGGRPPAAANSIEIAANDISQMALRPDTIQLNMVKWGQDEQSLASWITQLEQTPVSLDWIGLTTPGYKLPSPAASFVSQLAVTWNSFILSFYRDYTGVGSTYNNAITVWVGAGQFWAALMSQMANNSFTPQTGIHVNFNVVPGGSGIVLLSEVAGHGPDVATGMPATAPVDFALRDGAYDLSSFPGWQAVKDRFVPAATIPYQYTDASGHTGTYGAPETQGLTLMFYRKDILSGLNLIVPKTWTELYNILPIINSHGMEFYYPPTPAGFLPFLYQYGGEYYQQTPQGIRAAINSDAGFEAVTRWTQLFTDWQVPLSANFYTRFQTGEEPLGVGDYTTYVQLNTAAPQLSGLWAVAPIPGVPYLCDAQGKNCTEDTNKDSCSMPDYPDAPKIATGQTCKINDTSGGDSTVVMIPKSSQHPKEAWEFIQWWTSTQPQLQFSNDIQAVAGPQNAWNTANVAALAGLPWPQQDLNVFQKVWDAYQPVPIVPGGYISDRYINNIWTNIVINSQNVRAQLQWAQQNINDELYRQEVQFGLTKQVAGNIATGA